MAPSLQAGVSHDTMWADMTTKLIQQIHRSHFDAFIHFLKVELKMSDIEDEVRSKSVIPGKTAPPGRDFLQQKRHLMEYLEERHSKDGILKFLLVLADKIQMNLSHDGHSVNLKDYLQRFQSDWRQARKKAREEGDLDEGEFVGREEALKKVREMINRNTEKISGVFICGMYGSGKTTLATEVPKRCTKLFDKCFIDLKGINTADDLFYKLKRKLGMKTIGEGVNWSQIVDRLQNYNNDLLIILDGVEQLLEPGKKGRPDLDEEFSEANWSCEEMISVLVDITNIANSKVKLILTSQLDIWADDIHARYSPSVYEDIKSLRRTLEIYRLANFSKTECRMLIEKVAPAASQKMLSAQFLKIAIACGRNALGVQLVANYLKTIKEPVDKVIDKITEEAQKLDRGGQKKMTRVFSFIFNGMAKDSCKLLIQLSAFDTPFDVTAAIKVTGSGPSKMAMAAALDVLIKRHLLEVEDIRDSQKSEKISIYDFTEHKNIRLSLHTLTQQFSDDICVPGGRGTYTAIRLEAEKNKQNYYRQLISKLGRQVVHDSLAASLTLSEYRGQLKECINQTITDETVLPSFVDGKNFRKQYNSHVVMEWFLKPKKRALYYFEKAKLAKQSGDMVSFVGMNTWYADTFFDGASYDPEEVKKVLQEIKTALGDEVNFPQKSKDEGRDLVRGHYFYVQARYHFTQNEAHAAIEISRNCVKIFKEVLGYDLATARALNLVGSVYHSKGDQPKQSLKYHAKACHALEKLAQRYSSDIHFDSVMFYQNVGSQYHSIGNSIADEMDMNIMPSARRDKLKKRKLAKYQRALEYYKRSIDVITQLHMNGTWNHAMILRNMCTLLSELGEVKQALESAKEAHHIAEMFLSKDTFLQIKSNSILATAHCDMAEEAFGKGDIDEFDKQMFNAEKCFHYSAQHAIRMGRTAENHRVLERLMKDYRRHLYSLGKCEEAQEVTKVFETMLTIKPLNEEIPPNLYQRMKKSVARLFWREPEALRRPQAEDLPTPYPKKYEEEFGIGDKVRRPVHVSWRDRGRRYWWKIMFVFEPLHRIWYRLFSRGQGQGQVQTAAAQTAISSATKRKQDSGSSVEEKRRKIDDREGVNPGDVNVPQDLKIAKVFEENDSDASSNVSEVTTRRRLKVKRSTPVKSKKYDDDAMSNVSEVSSRASTSFYKNFDEVSRFGEDFDNEEENNSDADSGGVGEEAMDFESGSLAIPETHLTPEDPEAGAKPPPLPYAGYSEKPGEEGQGIGKGVDLSSSGYFDVSSMHGNDQGDA